MRVPRSVVLVAWAALLLPSCCTAQCTVGQYFDTGILTDAFGEPENNNFGWTVSMNGEGSVVAVGAPADQPSGSVSVFEMRDGSWDLRGQKITHEDIPTQYTPVLTGRSLSLSEDGLTVAAGATKATLVWRFTDEQQWAYMGDWATNPMNSEGTDFRGNDVALSYDGDTIVVGDSTAYRGGFEIGVARVYDWTGSAWVKRGSDLWPADPDVEKVMFGTSVDISSCGTRVAVGGPFRGGATGTRTGMIRVYDWSGYSWRLVGGEIVGPPGGGGLGAEVSLSRSGEYVASGDGARVVVYRLQGGSWEQLGSTLVASTWFGSENVEFGRSLDISEDGSVLLVGAYYHNNAQGAWLTFALESGDWALGKIHKPSRSLPSEYAGYSVSLSNDGQRYAVGAYRGAAPAVYTYGCFARCAAGTFSATGNVPCTECPAGSHSSQDGSKLCDECGLGQYSSPEPAPTACLPCPPDTYSDSAGLGNPGQCTPCPDNTNAPPGSMACSPWTPNPGRPCAKEAQRRLREAGL